MCVTPFSFNFNSVTQFVEMVEVNRMFGADRFVFYNLSLGSSVDAYLRHYIDTGTADVIQWPLPRSSQTQHGYIDVYYFAQVASYADCLQRYLDRSEYIAFLDMDEILVPRAADKWQGLLHVHGNRSLIFRNAFYRIEWPKDTTYSNDTRIVSYNIRTLLCTLREQKIWPGGARSKYIVRTRDLCTPGIHTPMFCNRGGRSTILPESHGLLHHYRSWENPSVTGSVRDPFMFKYRNMITERITRVHEDLGWAVNSDN